MWVNQALVSAYHSQLQAEVPQGPDVPAWAEALLANAFAGDREVVESQRGYALRIAKEFEAQPVEEREIVEAVAHLVDLPNNRYESRCCGAGAGLQTAFPKLSKDLAAKRVAEAKATGATTLVTSCPFCETQLRTVPGTKVADLMELLMDATTDIGKDNGQSKRNV